MIGDIYRFSTEDGPAYLHHVARSRWAGDVVAVHTNSDIPTTADQLAAEAFSLLFPIDAAVKSGLLEKIARAKPPEKFNFDHFRYPFYNRHRQFLYWVVRENGKERRNVKSLGRAELSYPLAVVVDAAILERLILADSNYNKIEFN